MTDFKTTAKNAESIIDDLNKTYTFNYFMPINTNINSTDLQQLYAPIENTTTPSLNMTPLNNNLNDLHSNKTCKINASNIQSKISFDELTNPPNLSIGLYCNIYNERFDNNNPFFTNLNNTFCTNTLGIVTDDSKLPDIYLNSVECLGYFIPNSTNSWTITTNANLLWIGDNAVNDYSSKNANINANANNATKSFTLKYTKNNNYPIRIQYGGNSNNTKLILNVTLPNGTIAPFNSVFKTTQNGIFYNKLTYYALVENSKDNTNKDLFNCYVSVVTPNDPISIQLQEKQNKYTYKEIWKFNIPVNSINSNNYLTVDTSKFLSIYNNNNTKVVNIWWYTNGKILLDDDGCLMVQSTNNVDWYYINQKPRSNITEGLVPNHHWRNEYFNNDKSNTIQINTGEQIGYNKTTRGTILISNNNKFKLKITSDGNLVIIGSVPEIIKTEKKKGDKEFKYSYNKNGITFYPYRVPSTKLNNNMYLESKVDPVNTTLNYVPKDMLTSSNLYSQHLEYYPINGSIASTNTQSCQEQCNADSNCTSYFETLNNSNSKSCILNNTTPSIMPKNDNLPYNSSSLYIRNMNINFSAQDLRKNIPIKNIDNYSSFTDYEIITNNPISNIIDSGLNNATVDPIYKYKQFINGDSSQKPNNTTETFDNHGYNSNVFESTQKYPNYAGIPQNIQQQQIVPLTAMLNDYSTLQTTINANESKLNTTIGDYTKLKSTLDGRDPTQPDNKKYDFKTGNVLNYLNKKPTIHDALNEDMNTMILSQNNIYMLGTITIATLLIATIYMSRE